MINNLSTYFWFESYHMRRATDADVPQLVAIINAAYSYQDEAMGMPRTSQDHLTKRISETDFYVVKGAEQLVGCVYLESCEESLHFGLLTVIPDLRGTGLAPSIIEAIEKYAISNTYHFIDIDYMSLAPWLKKYYEKYGFIETGDTTVWGSIDLVRMRKRLG